MKVALACLEGADALETLQAAEVGEVLCDGFDGSGTGGGGGNRSGFGRSALAGGGHGRHGAWVVLVLCVRLKVKVKVRRGSERKEGKEERNGRAKVAEFDFELAPVRVCRAEPLPSSYDANWEVKGKEESSLDIEEKAERRRRRRRTKQFLWTSTLRADA